MSAQIDVIERTDLQCDAQDAIERLGFARILTWEQVRRVLAIVWNEHDLEQLRCDVVLEIAAARARGDELHAPRPAAVSARTRRRELAERALEVIG